MQIDLSKYKNEKKPLAKLRPGEKTLGGDSKYINPKRKIGKAKKKTLIEKIFS